MFAHRLYSLLMVLLLGGYALPAWSLGQNVALASNGGTASASSVYSSGFPAQAINNGDRNGVNWGAGGVWSDATAKKYPDWAQITFNGVKSIEEIDVFSVQDDYTNPVEPTPTMTFSKYGLKSFKVQYWNGAKWVTVSGGQVSGNTLVWRKFTFPAIKTDRIRVSISSALGGYSRVTELEAYETSANVLPSVSFTAPTSGSAYTAPATITLSANATDSDGTIARVEFYNGATLLNTDSGAPYGYTWSNVAAGSYTLTAKAYDNAGGSTVSAPINVTVLAPVPSVILSASPGTVTSGASSTLTWSSTDATSCTASGAWSGSKATSGNQSTGALTATSTYTLTCTGAGGSASQSTTVTVTPVTSAPTVSLTASPLSVSSGGASTLTWSSANATSCSASGAWSGAKALSGSQTTGALSVSSVYTLTCTGSGGSASQSVTVTVTSVSGCTTTGATGAIALSTIPSRISGVAPLSVFFDAAGTTATTTTHPFHDLEYRWDFGDPAGSPVRGTTWGTGARAGVSSRNTATGPEATHVFETPGTYTVAVTATDGANTVSNSCTQIVVQDPNAVFAGTNTVCFSTSGAYTDCPSGATHVTTSDFAAAINNYKAPNRRLLFRRGETFTAASSGTLDVTGPGIIGAFGAGTLLPKAKITTGAAFPIIQLSGPYTPGIGDWRIMDFELDGSSVINSDVSGVGAFGGFNQLLVLRLNIHDIYRGVAAGPDILDWWNNNGQPGHTIFDEWSVVDSTMTGIPGCNSPGNYNCDWRVYQAAKHSTVQGNYLDNQDTGGSHVLRSEYTAKGVFSNNTLARAGDFQLAIKLHAKDWTTPGVTNPGGVGTYSEQVVIADNKIIGGINPWTLSLGPQDEINDERVRDVIVERNWFVAGKASQLHMHINSFETTIRNNICDLTGAAYHTCVSVDQWGITPAPSNVRVYNNTLYSGASGDFIGVEIGTAFNTTVQNNLAYAPLATDYVMISGTGSELIQSNNSTNAQLKSTAPGWVSTTPVIPADFKLTSGSYALGAGTLVPVLSDFFLLSRPSNDLGAAER